MSNNKQDNIVDTKTYREFFVEIKERIQSAQLRALRVVNRELIDLYWGIGELIVKKQDEQNWGKAVVEVLAHELQLDFPGIQGFSSRNLWNMRNFFLTYKDNEKLQQLVAEIGWSHNVAILERCKDNLEREYYMQMAIRNSWSRETIISSIKNQSYEKFLLNQTNFEYTLPEKKFAQAKLAVKDDYTFNFLELSDGHLEKELERGLVDNIRRFLLEMGHHFTFVGNQYRIEVDNKEFYIDLLLYHRKLRSLVAIELKRGEFQPEYIGKMQFYLTALDNTVRVEGENPSIGIIICREKSRTLVEYTLKDVNKPMGVATYTTGKTLPSNIANLLPTPEEIAKHLKIFDKEK
jgi:predicted nuclease of restriction endonuclease-like (RecB) superfamily